MKKLLLVMLVSLLAFGFMGCDNTLIEGNEVPYWIQGQWSIVTGYGGVFPESDAVSLETFTHFAISPNQLVMFDKIRSLPFKTEFRYYTDQTTKTDIRVDFDPIPDTTDYTELFEAFQATEKGDWTSVDWGVSITAATDWVTLAPSVIDAIDIKILAGNWEDDYEMALSLIKKVYGGFLNQFKAFITGGSVIVGADWDFDPDAFIDEIAAGYLAAGTAPLASTISDLDDIIDEFGAPYETLIAPSMTEGQMRIYYLDTSDHIASIDLVFFSPNTKTAIEALMFITNVDIKEKKTEWKNWLVLPYVGTYFRK